MECSFETAAGETTVAEVPGFPAGPVDEQARAIAWLRAGAVGPMPAILRTGCLQGADLRGARLPDGCIADEALNLAEEVSKNTGNAFLSMLLACAFTWLTIATTRDVALLTNNATSKLPIINADIPILGFYMVAPVL